MNILIRPDGSVWCLYDEALDLRPLGKAVVTRASHVEPDAKGCWWADLAPQHGPKLGPFPRRSDALLAERQWLEQQALAGTGSYPLPSTIGNRMKDLVLALSSLATFVAVVAFLRERRWRRALQTLLQRLFAKWKTHEPPTSQDAHRRSAPHDAPDGRL